MKPKVSYADFLRSRGRKICDGWSCQDLIEFERHIERNPHEIIGKQVAPASSLDSLANAVVDAARRFVDHKLTQHSVELAELRRRIAELEANDHFSRL